MPAYWRARPSDVTWALTLPAGETESASARLPMVGAHGSLAFLLIYTFVAPLADDRYGSVTVAVGGGVLLGAAVLMWQWSWRLVLNRRGIDTSVLAPREIYVCLTVTNRRLVFIRRRWFAEHEILRVVEADAIESSEFVPGLSGGLWHLSWREDDGVHRVRLRGGHWRRGVELRGAVDALIASTEKAQASESDA